MTAILRDIIVIDEDLCDGCGDCIGSCEEGALEIVDGKVRLKAEVLCDGAGACIGHCPTGALKIEKQQADAYDEAAVAQNLAASQSAVSQRVMVGAGAAGGCPGSAVRQFSGSPAPSCISAVDTTANPPPTLPSELRQWPVQLMLLPPNAPYFQNADLLLAADCVPFAYPNFHQNFLKGRALAVGCPKLDDLQHYIQKLTEMFRVNNLKSVEVLLMEVPCCGGLGQAARIAKEQAGVDFPLKVTVFGLRGDVLGTQEL